MSLQNYRTAAYCGKPHHWLFGVRTMTLTPEPIQSPNYETYAADELGKMRGLRYLGFCVILLEGGIFAFRGQKIQGEKL